MKNLKLFLAAATIALSASCSENDNNNNKEIEPVEDTSITICETGFETGTDESPYTENSWKTDGFDPRWVQGFGEDRAFIDTEHAHTGNSSLRISYPADTWRPIASGVQAPLMFDPRNEVYVSYWMRFSDNFDWGGEYEGGKLPGLAGGSLCSGGASCDGTNGFSARLMWRTGGKLVLYLYHMDKPKTYGEDFNLVTSQGTVYVEKGSWIHVEERVKINTGNNNDGEVQIWINGEEALVLTDIRFVNDGSLVDVVYFSTFHGGSTSVWAPSVDCFIWFDDLRIFYN